MTTTNMGLTLNVVGVTPDPTWSNNLNTDLNIIDSHDHSTGNGVNITPAAININSDLNYNFHNITAVRSWRMQNQVSTLVLPTDINCGYFVNGNFYVNNASGTAVQITSGAGLNFASLGTIGGDFGQPGVTAAVTYNNTTKIYTFTSSAGIYSTMATGPLQVFNVAAASQPITINAPTGVTPYTLTLPAAVPASSSVLAVSNAGIGSYIAYTTANTVNTMVLRDGTGNVNAKTLTADSYTGGLVTAGGAAVTLKMATYNGTIASGVTFTQTVAGATTIWSQDGNWSATGQFGKIGSSFGGTGPGTVTFAIGTLSTQFLIYNHNALTISYVVVVFYT